MRRLILLLLVLIISGCTIPTEPNYTQNNFVDGHGYYDSFLYRSPIPNGSYDALFVTQLHSYDYLDSAGKDISNYWYESQATLYNALHNVIDIPSNGLSIQVDGTTLAFKRYYQYDTNIDLNFPSPVSWVMSGDNYFPSFDHSISSENPIEILSPALEDSLDATAGFTLTYNAPGADSMTVMLQYDGMGISQADTTNQVGEYFDFQQFLIPNSSNFAVTRYKYDQRSWKTYTPQSMLVSVAWARGDTVHVGGKVFGFVTEVSTSKEYFFKR